MKLKGGFKFIYHLNLSLETPYYKEGREIWIKLIKCFDEMLTKPKRRDCILKTLDLISLTSPASHWKIRLDLSAASGAHRKIRLDLPAASGAHRKIRSGR